MVEKLHVLDFVASTIDLSSFRLSPLSSSFYLWHSRLGHVSESRLKYLVSNGALGNLHTHDISDCSGCKLAKFTALPFNKSSSISVAPFDLIHSDVWGPAPIASKGGSKYYVSFIDDYSRFCWIYLMKHRSEFFNIYRNFRALVRTQYASTIKCFRCDLGGEYTKTAFCDLLASDGTIHQSSCTDTPQQNGVAERKHRHIVETARSLLLSASVPSVFWGEAVLTAVHLINMIPIALTSGISPFERLTGKPPDYLSLRVFGCTCFVLRPRSDRTKLSARSAMCVFLGYSEGQKGYRCYDPNAKKLYVSRHVDFLEQIPFFSIPTGSNDVTKSDLIHIDPFYDDIDALHSSMMSPSVVSRPPIIHTYSRRNQNVPSAGQHPPPLLAHSPSTSDDVDPIVPIPSRYPQRSRKPPSRFNDFTNSCYFADFSSFLVSIHSLSEPTSYKEASLDPLWQQAMDEELSALQKTGMWDLVVGTTSFS